ncbi:hypothetical protein A3H10_04685 [Candidatus Uhrbacteria bacterium RIFCSPLOWO2_12_FULL_46_10]|nr:MAG: hypothetical protein UX68_C0006G0041 [Parcubacteria group bacterium GW2011_GWA2_46_9]OGL69462.1 MAG: hypothetical protein A3D60_03255 [Candidatus Uhrbacteria bacterium RIFCSPHIGHO2_02_FULL_47_29]OGL85895.1 MAG: hypothetical protein A3I37_00885 [Candidatus Uhrbacteria bacterium RIFCSPLOWO2_02_FULL_46_19]OGL91056.1 MAG: hypothetical protein A3H10_04685 [Candidatus Uhrbacteria bacterium RIFCSPLOWO2_12_FULL_46_10]
MSELKRMYLQDQEARRRLSTIADPTKRMVSMLEVSLDDIGRLLTVLELIGKQEIIFGQDHLCAAVILHHSGVPALCQMAHEFALKAVAMDYRPETDEFDLKWLAAAALDRMLVQTGRPQSFGTQYNPETDERYPVDPNITDENRRQWNVRPLSGEGDKPLVGYGSE